MEKHMSHKEFVAFQTKYIRDRNSVSQYAEGYKRTEALRSDVEKLLARVEYLEQIIVDANNVIDLPLDAKHDVECHADALPKYYLALAACAEQAATILGVEVCNMVEGE